jgi:hypothetical protein
MRGRSMWRAALVGALMVGVLAGCGDDEDEAATDTTAAESGGESADNTIKIEMVDYGYKVTGDLKSGLATLESTNTGDEWHMAGFARLKAGKTVEQLVTALQQGGGGEGGPAEGGGATETTGSGATLRAAGQETTTTTAAEGGGEGEGGDPFAEFVEEELGSPGHILQPGQTQKLTVDNLDAGSYVMLCFLPTEGEGTPHFAKGMVGGFEVAEEAADVEEPEAEATITLGDEAEPTGVPTELSSGEHTFKVTAEGENGKDFIIGQMDEGKEFGAFDEYFESENGFESESGPPKGYAEQAPGTVLVSTFEISPGESIWVTVDVPKGETYFVGTTNIESEDDEETIDKFVKVNVS